ncbi:MAG: sensor histidine kinase [Verrucomicrobiota bacterium]
MDALAVISQHRVLSCRLETAQEAERSSIARELHNEIGQALIVLQLNLQSMLQTPGTDALTARLLESLKVVERLIGQVHDISLNLRPPVLDNLGLESALHWLAERQADLGGLRAGFHADPLKLRVDHVIETACFRVAQEAVTNVVRHARAQSLSVELRLIKGRLHLRVSDDGIGFEVAAARKRAMRGASLGLLVMEERTAVTGGGVEFSSEPGKGTEVQAWFPLIWQNQTTQSVDG